VLPSKHSSTHAVGEACAHVQGESLKAHAALLVRLLNSPITRTGNDMACVGLVSPSQKSHWYHAFSRAIFALTIYLGALQPSSALAQQVYQKRDSFSGATYFFTKRRDADLEGGSFFSGRYVAFDLAFISSTPALVSLGVHTHTGGWIFIRDGASLDLKINGIEFIKLEGPGSQKSREVLDADLVAEDASYLLTPDQLSKIVKAKTVEFRLYGDRQIITGSLSPEFRADAKGLNDFIATTPVITSGDLSVGGASPAGPSDRPSLGVHYTPLNKAAIAAIHFPYDHGLMVGAVDNGSTAAKSGLQKADVILSIDGAPATGLNDLPAALDKVGPGDQMKLHLWRRGDELDIIAKF
jgi:hypothetical protein